MHTVLGVMKQIYSLFFLLSRYDHIFVIRGRQYSGSPSVNLKEVFIHCEGNCWRKRNYVSDFNCLWLSLSKNTLNYRLKLLCKINLNWHLFKSSIEVKQWNVGCC